MSLMPEIEGLGTIFLEGPAGTGKSSQAVARMDALIDQGVPPDEILLLTPQRSYTVFYEEQLDTLTWHRIGKATVGGVAQRMVSLFWPLVVEVSSYSFDEDRPPTFLTYETAQYFMARHVFPLIEQGYFSELKLTRNRLYSQLLDNLNKAAVNRIPLDQVHAYLQSSAAEDASKKSLFDDISKTINAYRQYTVSHNLLDFSLYNEVFWELLSEEEVREYMVRQFRHIIYDNVEEDFPLAHDIVQQWIQMVDSALIIFDTDGGYRKFLAANPNSAMGLKQSCEIHVQRDENHRTPPHLLALAETMIESVHREPFSQERIDAPTGVRFHLYSDRLYHQMVAEAASRVIALVQDAGVEAQDIAVISPFLSDSLHFALASRLDKEGVLHYTHRPSRVLYDQPMTRVMLCLATLAHPEWGLRRPSVESVRHMLNRLIGPLDLVRAALLADAGYEEASDGVGLRAFERMPVVVRDRISYATGKLYEELRRWLEDYHTRDELPIDHFFSRVFGEKLSQAGYGLHQDVEGGVAVGNLVESARKFRRAVSGVLDVERSPAGKAYVEMVQEGVVSAFYDIDWTSSREGVLLTPVHTFLLRNRIYPYQVWLDVGSPTWYRRIPQPLTNPYVMSRDWHVGNVWNAKIEKQFETERLERIILGLTRRCSERIYAYRSEVGASGQEQMGDFLSALDRVKRAYTDTSFTFNDRDV